eukprot:CAMPEP_0206584988 /NCGR_PEP_ID=MMETSP0325_2-20121206/36124_1 /ASSEMBLY_ACC=CAM_ASM_000347 /TAXON_ID=2866 /ORGANISM="Crypthecodinium cohnii, Strain Seligo" /LENGTH=144 /DNA_ID=CAMNT_0054092399 /DNA_START=189 /DNA_END=623 /DNA_ORIENTATION=-
MEVDVFPRNGRVALSAHILWATIGADCGTIRQLFVQTFDGLFAFATFGVCLSLLAISTWNAVVSLLEDDKGAGEQGVATFTLEAADVVAPASSLRDSSIDVLTANIAEDFRGVHPAPGLERLAASRRVRRKLPVLLLIFPHAQV